MCFFVFLVQTLQPPGQAMTVQKKRRRNEKREKKREKKKREERKRKENKRRRERECVCAEEKRKDKTNEKKTKEQKREKLENVGSIRLLTRHSIVPIHPNYTRVGKRGI